MHGRHRRGCLAEINDVRYLTALLQAIEQAKQAGYDGEAQEAEQYVAKLHQALPWDFQGMRRELAERTVALYTLSTK